MGLEQKITVERESNREEKGRRGREKKIDERKEIWSMFQCGRSSQIAILKTLFIHSFFFPLDEKKEKTQIGKEKTHAVFEKHTYTR